VHEKRKNGTTTIYLLPLLYFLLFVAALHGKKKNRSRRGEAEQVGQADWHSVILAFQPFSQRVIRMFSTRLG